MAQAFPLSTVLRRALLVPVVILMTVADLHPSLHPAPAPAASVLPVPAPAAPRTVPSILAVDQRIKDRLNQLRPAVKRRLAHVARRLPQRVKLLVTSAYRTTEEQKNLRPTFGVKARSGHSPHEDGRAIDLNVLVDGERITPRKNHAVIGKIMAEAGFQYLGHHDPVHFVVSKQAAHHDESSPHPLDIMTMDELSEIRAEARGARSAASVGVGVPEASAAALP